MLGVLLDEGMNVARLNFSHGDHAAHAGTIERLKQALAKRPGVHCAIMLDTKGPEIRTGFFDASVGDKLKLTKGHLPTMIRFVHSSRALVTSAKDVPTEYLG